jgi:hypothetical protein
MGAGAQMEIRRQYQKGYGEADLTELALEMKDWEEEQVWPEPCAAVDKTRLNTFIANLGESTTQQVCEALAKAINCQNK